jgi:hypothetical protein
MTGTARPRAWCVRNGTDFAPTLPLFLSRSLGFPDGIPRSRFGLVFHAKCLKSHTNPQRERGLYDPSGKALSLQ